MALAQDAGAAIGVCHSKSLGAFAVISHVLGVTAHLGWGVQGGLDLLQVMEESEAGEARSSQRQP